LVPQPSLGLAILHKIWLNFVEASQQFSFLEDRVFIPTSNPISLDQVSVFISPRGRVATLLLHIFIVLFFCPSLIPFPSSSSSFHIFPSVFSSFSSFLSSSPLLLLV